MRSLFDPLILLVGMVRDEGGRGQLKSVSEAGRTRLSGHDKLRLSR